jgi:hypothetical protein
MSEHSRIEWTSASWNPATGCDEVSPGCAHCYAKAFAERFRGVPGHPYEDGFDLRLWPERLLMLNHPRPEDFLRPDADVTADAIRAHYDAQLGALGLIHIARRHVNITDTNSPLYDIVFASRKDTAVELWEKANQRPESDQLRLLDFDAS